MTIQSHAGNDALTQKLREELKADNVSIIDFSWQHAGHMGLDPHSPDIGGTHLRIIIVSPLFVEMGLIDRHRCVHTALADAFAQKLHALELKVFSPDEWEALPEDKRTQLHQI